MSENLTSTTQQSTKVDNGPARAWLIDLDGTLYRAPWVRLAMALQLLTSGRRAIPILRTFRRELERIRHDLHEVHEESDSPFDLQLQRTATLLGREKKYVASIVEDWMHRRPGMWLRLFRRRRLLLEIESFREAGGLTALVSDYPAIEKLRALRATKLFDVVIANGEPGGPLRLKPFPDGYQLAAKHLKIEPAECLVLGDRHDADGEAARRAGMRFRKI